MAKERGTKKGTKSEFLRKVLGKNPDLDHAQVNSRWTKTGHSGEISSALFYHVRSQMGIRTEWHWVKEPGPETGEAVLPGASRKNHLNDDLVGAAKNFLPQILLLYRRFEEKRPVMLLELPDQKIYAYPYKEFKDDLSERSQKMLTDEYEKAIAGNKVVVFVRDDKTQRLVSMSFDYE